MKITWKGTASIIIEAAGERILFDPFVQLIGGAHPNVLEDFLPEETIFITHGHFDHLFYLPEILEQGDATVFCTACPARTLADFMEDTSNVAEIRPGDALHIGGVSVKAYQAKHIHFDRRLFCKTLSLKRMLKYWRNVPFLIYANRRFQEGGETVAYEVKAEGKSVFLLGSLSLAEHVAYPSGMDLLILPFQGNSDLERAALDIIRQLKPKRILLSHFDDAFPPISRNVDTRLLKKKMMEEFPGIAAVKPKAGKEVLIP
ncbi:MAG: MBL fold metallo-hydrolase [Lachnospiraceae bacterium]|nr:MBL fold metallo-hydrolase [Lachnospiraceae bacterium]